MLEAYFAQTQAKHVISGFIAGNRGSSHVLRKLGFAETGRSTVHSTPRRGDVEHIDMQLTRANWKTARAA